MSITKAPVSRISKDEMPPASASDNYQPFKYASRWGGGDLDIIKDGPPVPIPGERRVGFIGRERLGENDYFRLRFSLPSETVEQMRRSGRQFDVQREYNKLGRASRFLPETAESSRQGITGEKRLSNEAVRTANYGFTLSNANGMQANIAAVLIAKIENDRDIKSTFEDFFSENGRWKDAGPSAIMEEVNYRLMGMRGRTDPQYRVLLKMMEKFGEISKKQKDFERARAKSFLSGIDAMHERYVNDLLGAHNTDLAKNTPKAKKAILSSMSTILKDAQSSSSDNYYDPEQKIGSYVLGKLDDAMIEGRSVDNAFYVIREAIEESGGNFGDKTFREIEKGLASIQLIEKDFADFSNSAMADSTKAVEKLHLSTDELPAGILAALANPESLDKLIDQEREDIEKAINSAIEQSLSSVDRFLVDEDFIQEKRRELEELLGRHRDQFEYLYNPKKDELDSRRRYSAESVMGSAETHDVAIGILRDAFYLTALRSYDHKTIAGIVKNKQAEKEILLSSLDPKIERMRPKEGEVNDLFNGYLLLEKASSSEMAENEIMEIIKSDIFTNGKAYSVEELSTISTIGIEMSELALESQQERAFGALKPDDLSLSIQEMGYFNHASRMEEKIRPSWKNLGGILQGNEVLANFVTCLEGAKNPKTSVETPSSMAAGCISNFERDLDQLSEEAKKGISQANNAILVFNPVLSLLVLRVIIADALALEAKKDMLRVNREVAENVGYINDAEDHKTSAARRLLVASEELGVAGIFVGDGAASSVVSAAEKESVAKDLIKTKDVGNLSFALDRRYSNLLSKAVTAEVKEEEARSVERLRTLNNELLSLQDKIRRGEIADEEIRRIEERVRIQEELIAEEERKANEPQHGNTIISAIIAGGIGVGAAIKDGGNDARLATMKALHSYKESLYEMIIEGGEDGGEMGEIEKSKKIIDAIRKEVLGSSETAGEVIDSIVREKSGKGLSLVTLSDITRNGLKKDGIKSLMDREFPELSTEARIGMGGKIAQFIDMQEKIRSGGVSNVDLNGISKYMGSVEKASPKIKKVFSSTNSFYASIASSSSGKSYVNGGMGLNGYAVMKANEAEEKGEYGKSYAYLSAISSNASLSREAQQHIAQNAKTIQEANMRATKRQGEALRNGNTKKPSPGVNL